ncbi:phage/plasmid primase, P4 family [Paractinoplanes ovalisporus]|nr:phage/plasmid primase, P4 family [Actinoplanes ovalisporus]
MRAAALAWHDAGCGVIPIRADGSKAPLVSWRTYQRERASRDQVERWFRGDPPGLAVVSGAVSGGLEMLELEGRALPEGFARRLVGLLASAGLEDLWRRIAVDGYSERTPSGGIHLIYRLSDVPVGRNLKLARRPATEDELVAEPHDKIKVLAETRGEGGYTIVAPSHGAVHESGRPWLAISGSVPTRIPTITSADRAAIFAVVRSLDEMPTARQLTPPRSILTPEVTPGNDFESRADWTDILQPAGWVLVHQTGQTRYWRRPGKSVGVSATTGRAADRDRLFVFTTSTVFPPDTPVTKFHAYALLHHDGDHVHAARALRIAGFGDQSARSAQVVAGVEDLTTGLIGDSAEPEPTGDKRPEHAEVLSEDLPTVAAWGPTEDGLARALVAHHGHELRYCPQRSKWLVWDGCRWAWDEAERHRELVRALARDLPQTGRWRRFRASALSAGGVSGVVRLARSDPAVIVPVSALDSQPYQLNTPRGVIDLRTGTISPSDPMLLHTRCTAATPDFDRRSDVFERFLADTFGEDQDLSGYVQRLLGVSAIGVVLEQLLPFAVGPGANGKSTLLEAAMHALGRDDGGYAIAAPSEMLMVRQHAEHPAELAQLAGARLVVCAELDEGQRFAEARVKQLTGRDSINARFMRGNPFTYLPSHTLWLLGNHLPAARAGGPAFWRRIRVLPFTRVVPDNRQDRRLGEQLATDAPAVLAWIVAGAAAYQRSGLREPASVASATEAYARDADTVGRFVEDACRVVGIDTARVGTTVLRDTYEQWCDQAGERPVSAKRLTQDLRRFGIGEARGSKGRRFYTGVVLRGVDEEPVVLVDRAHAQGDG